MKAILFSLHTWMALVSSIFVVPFSAFAQTFTGSGFFISKDGYFVTNYHVIENAETVRIRTSGGVVYEANIIATDKANDLAVVKAVGAVIGEPFQLRSSSELSSGVRVFTMGFPQTQIQGVEVKVTDGIVSSSSGMSGDPRFFQISVPVQPGNSGGPLIGLDGAVVGVVTSKLNALAVLKKTGTLPEGVNYAIKSNYLLELLGTLAQREPLRFSLEKGRLPFTDLAVVVHRMRDSVGMVIATGSGIKRTEMPADLPTPKSTADVVVYVNSAPITKADVQYILDALVKAGRPDTPELRSAVLDELIARELFVQAAMNDRVSESVEFVRQFENARQEILIRALIKNNLAEVGTASASKEFEKTFIQKLQQTLRSKANIVLY